MRSTYAILVFLGLLGLPAGAQTASNASAASSSSSSADPATVGKQIDGIAARIGNDVVTESEVRQLEDYQRLIDGQAQSRANVIQELVDQWIVRAEAATSNFPHPTAEEVGQEFQELVKQFATPEKLQAQLAEVGLTTAELRQLLEKQLYYERFLNYKFHTAADVTSAQIEAYYKNDFSVEAQRRGMTVPPLDKVEAQIRQLLTQETINEKAAQWLSEAKAKLKIVIQPGEGTG
jgi:hypothetical protein